MNRRKFIKSAAILPVALSSCKEDTASIPPVAKDVLKSKGVRWEYIVYCYEREQGEWMFNQNTRGSFDYQREYMTFEEDEGWPYAGWMDGGKLHFVTIEEAADFVEMHVRVKDDEGIKDSIYDIYHLDLDDPRLIDRPDLKPEEIQVAHYWYDGDTGRQVTWMTKPAYPNYSNQINYA